MTIGETGVPGVKPVPNYCQNDIPGIQGPYLSLVGLQILYNPPKC